MEEMIKSYIEIALGSLYNSGDSVKLKGVYPAILSDFIEGWDWSEADTNGWQVDYWITTDKYEIYGGMYYGEATITLR